MSMVQPPKLPKCCRPRYESAAAVTIQAPPWGWRVNVMHQGQTQKEPRSNVNEFLSSWLRWNEDVISISLKNRRDKVTLELYFIIGSPSKMFPLDFLQRTCKLDWQRSKNFYIVVFTNSKHTQTVYTFTEFIHKANVTNVKGNVQENLEVGVSTWPQITRAKPSFSPIRGVI